MVIGCKKSNELIEFIEDDGSCTIYHKRSKREIFIGEMEYSILNMLNGMCNSNSIIEKYPLLNEKTINDLIKIFSDKGLLEGTEKKKKINILDIDVVNIKAKNFISVHSDRTCLLCNLFLLFSFFSSIVTTVLLLIDLDLDYLMIKETFFHVTFYKIIYYIVIILTSISLHEKGHAFMANTVGVHVVHYNIGLVSFFPCVSTVFCGINKCRSDRKILKIEMAGIGVNLGIYSFLGILWLITGYIWLIPFFLFNITLAIFNLIILLKTDGYQILLKMLNVSKMKLQIWMEYKTNRRDCIFWLYYYALFFTNLLCINSLLLKL